MNEWIMNYASSKIETMLKIHCVNLIYGVLET